MRLELSAVAWLVLVLTSLQLQPLVALDEVYVADSLSASNEVPPTNVTTASGYGKFVPVGSKMYYEVFVTQLTNVTVGHLHVSPSGISGPIAVDLDVLRNVSNGILASGVITSTVLKGPLAGLEMADLFYAIRTGNVYVNVHTSEFPKGAIRDQLRVLSLSPNSQQQQPVARVPPPVTL